MGITPQEWTHRTEPLLHFQQDLLLGKSGLANKNAEISLRFVQIEILLGVPLRAKVTRNSPLGGIILSMGRIAVPNKFNFQIL